MKVSKLYTPTAALILAAVTTVMGASFVRAATNDAGSASNDTLFWILGVALLVVSAIALVAGVRLAKSNGDPNALLGGLGMAIMQVGFAAMVLTDGLVANLILVAGIVVIFVASQRTKDTAQAS